MRHDDVQRVGRAALEETDQDLSPTIAMRGRSAEELHAVHAAAKKTRAEPHRHHRERAGFHEDTTIHTNPTSSEPAAARRGCLTTLKLRRAEREADDLRQPLESHRTVEDRHGVRARP